MAINQIALLAQTPEFETPLESQGKALHIRQLMNQTQVQDMDMQQRREAIQRAAGLRSTLAGFKPDATPDEQVGALTRGGYLTEARSLAESSSKVAKEKRESEKFQLEGMVKKLELAGQIMGGVKDQASWDRARQQAAQVFGEKAAADMPAQYDQAMVEQNRQQALSVKEQLEDHWKKKGYDLEVQKAGETVRHNKSTEGITVRGQNMTDSRARQIADITREGQQTQVVTDPNQGVLLVNKGTKTAMPARFADGTAVPSENAVAAGKLNSQLQAGIEMARKLIPKATSSGAGALIDKGAGFFGGSTAGADAAAQLDTIAGWMTSNVPRMQGPQSDKDVLLYKQMAADVANRNLPASRRLAALDTLENLQGKYAEINKAPGATPPKPGPAAGTVEAGYRFKGGDPANKANWVKQ